MWKDPIVEEVRQARDKRARQFDYNIADIVADARRRQEASGHKVIRAPMKDPEKQKDAA